jgi:hypothetical protein
VKRSQKITITSKEYDYDPPKVARVEDDSGTHIEPPLDQSWSEIQKLQWAAAVAELDSGLRLRVVQSGDWSFPFGIQHSVWQSPHYALSYGDAWNAINLLMYGAQSYKRQSGIAGQL